MADWNKLSAEVEEQRVLIDQQNVELLRLRRQMKAQMLVAARIQAELDGLRATTQRGANRQRMQAPSNGNGHDSAYRLPKRDTAS